MNRPLTALFAALEALLVVGVGIGIPLVPLTLMWAFQYGLQLDWFVFWRGSVDAWVLGHGADVRFVLDPAIAAATGLPGAGDPFRVTIAPLGFALVTFLFAVRAGRRIGETSHHRLGQLTAIAVFAALAFGVTISAFDPSAQPSVVQGTVLPTAVLALGVAVGSAISRRRPRASGADRRGGGSHGSGGTDARDGLSDAGAGVSTGARGGRGRGVGAIRAFVGRHGPRWSGGAVIASSAGAAAAFTVIAVSAVVLAVIVAVDYGELIALYEGVQAGYLGGAALTIGQLAVLPNLVIFTASWFVGPGFAIGTGSAVSPLGTALGPLPAVPVLGALPTVDSPFAYAGLLVPVLAGFLAATLVRPRLVRAGLEGAGWLVGAGALIGIVGGAVLGALSWISAGSAGPGRLVEVGPSWVAVGGWAALEIGLPAIIALLVAGWTTGTTDQRTGAADREAPTGADDRTGVDEAAGVEDAAGSGVDDPASVDDATAPIPVQNRSVPT